jgi:hypothetical protein
MSEMYSGVQLCPELTPSARCIRVQSYSNGAFTEVFHHHLPRHRINDDDIVSMLKALILAVEQAPLEKIAQSYVNLRKGEPVYPTQLNAHVDYPEPGVHRLICGTDVIAWVDTVLDSAKFRTAGA